MNSYATSISARDSARQYSTKHLCGRPQNTSKQHELKSEKYGSSFFVARDSVRGICRISKREPNEECK
ncbi:hypothetical protein NDU88_000930 [Pleurodeles waltl]|uniref:Uncharacterized protein n=1 Tax=Pleurodeles waltl TaxID=8319 RepID=A0AAV7NDD0_PLEWA|nr:hypothetical protein NDU88_000930 [Pleurodeles waltl]